MENNTSYYLADWVAGTISDNELQEKVGEQQFHQYKGILEVSSHWQVPSRNMNHKAAFLKKMNAVEKAAPVSIWKVAAILVIGLLAATYYWSDTTIKTTLNQTQLVTIYDGTSIELAPSSELSYNKISYWFNRSVSFKGNGLFKVIPGNEFLVDNPKGTVQVLGTSFRIIDRLDYLKVSCFSGKVAVSMEGEKWVIEPNESIDSFTKEKIQIEENSEDAASYLNYNATPLKVVLDEISKHYSVQFQIQSINVDDLFSGNLNTENIDTALKSVLYPFNYNYEKKDVNLFEIYSLD